MRPSLFALVGVCTVLGLGAAAPVESPKDSVAITTHSAVRARTSPGASIPDRIGLQLEINYDLSTEQDGVVSLALDDHGEMEFSTFDTAEVTRGHGTIYLKAGARLIQRPELNCLVILKAKGAKPEDKPLAITAMTVDIKALSRRR